MHAQQYGPRPGNAPPDSSLTSGSPSLRSGPPSQYPAAVPQYTGNNSGLVDPEFHHGTTGQEQPPYASVDRKATSVHRPVDATRAGLVQSSRTREPHLGDHRATAIPVAASISRQTTASRKDIGGPGVEPDIRPRGSQPPVGASNPQSVPVHPASYSNPSGGSASKAAQSRVGRHEAVTSPGPTLSVSSLQPTTRPSPATIPPPSQNAPSARSSQETRGDPSFGPPRMEAPRKSDRSLLPQTDPHRDRNENRSRAQQLDRTPSVQSSAQSFTYPPPSLNRQNVPTSPSPSPAAPALTKSASIRMQAPQGTHPGGPQVRYGEGPSEFTRPYDERNAKPYAEETRYVNPSAAPHKQYSQPHPTVAPVEHLSRPQPAPDPRRLDKDNSRIHGIQGMDREAKRPTDELTSDKVRKRGPDERATHRGDSITHSGTAHRRKAEPNPTSSYAPDTARYPNAPPGSSVERAYSSSTRAYDSNAPHLPPTGDPRGQVGQSTALAPPLGGPQTFIAPPPPVFLSSTSEPKSVIRVPSNQGLIAPGTAPTQGASSPQGPSAPLSYPRSSNDFASRASREAQFESKAGSAVTSPLTHQPDHPLASQNAPPTQTRHDKGADSSFGVPGDRSAGSHYPYASATHPHDYANSKRPSMEQPSATAGFKTSYSRTGDPWSGGDSEAPYGHGQVLPHTQAEYKGHAATAAPEPWSPIQSHHAVPSSSWVDPTTRQPVGPVKQSHSSRQKNTSRDSRMSPLYPLHGNPPKGPETPVKETVMTQPSPMEISHPLANTVRKPADPIAQPPPPEHHDVGGPSESRVPEQNQAAPTSKPWATGPTASRRGDPREPTNTRTGPPGGGPSRQPGGGSPGSRRDQPAGSSGPNKPPGPGRSGSGGTPRTPGLNELPPQGQRLPGAASDRGGGGSGDGGGGGGGFLCCR